MLLTKAVKGPPIKMADNPVPQGCEQVPAVGTGIGMHEMTNTAEPINPTIGLKRGCRLLRAFRSRKPIATKGMAKANQRPAHCGGKIPSVMCIAWAVVGANRTQSNAIRMMGSVLIERFSSIFEGPEAGCSHHGRHQLRNFTGCPQGVPCEAPDFLLAPEGENESYRY